MPWIFLVNPGWREALKAEWKAFSWFRTASHFDTSLRDLKADRFTMKGTDLAGARRGSGQGVAGVPPAGGAGGGPRRPPRRSAFRGELGTPFLISPRAGRPFRGRVFRARRRQSPVRRYGRRRFAT